MFRAAAVLIAVIAASSAVHADEHLSIPVRVITTEFPPYSHVVDGRVVGTVTGLVRAVLDDVGIDPPIEVLPWPRAIATTLRTPNVLIYQVARTPERETELKWVGVAAAFDVRLFARADGSVPPLDAVERAKAYRVGGLLDDVKTKYLESLGIRPVIFTNEHNGVSMLLHHRIDLMASDMAAMRYRLLESGRSPDAVTPVLRLDEVSRPLYLAFSPATDDAIVARFRQALVTVRERGTAPGTPTQ